jgi:hypothetical protein
MPPTGTIPLAHESDSRSAGSDPDANVKYIPLLYLPSYWEPPAKNESAEFALAEFD